MRVTQEQIDNAEKNLRKNKSCAFCANADCRFIGDELPEYVVTCNITGKNRKGKTGFMCRNWEERS